MTDNTKWNKLLVRYLSGECSKEEVGHVKKLIKSDPDKKRELTELEKTWSLTGELPLEKNEEKSWEKVSSQLKEAEDHVTPIYSLKNNNDQLSEKKLHTSNSPTTVKANNFSWLLKIAAILLITSGISFIVYNLQEQSVFENGQSQRAMQEISTDQGERVRLKFSDGTEVLLNSSSLIRFPGKFVNNIREVELVKGEAYFNVENRGDIPFLVHTKDANIQVLGTKFNVNAYRTNEKVEVVVAEGKVAVRGNEVSQNSKEVVLTEGEFTEVAENGQPLLPRKVDLGIHLAWIDKTIIFDYSSFEEVLNKINDHYGVEFEVRDSTLFDRRLTTVFSDESLTKVMEVVSLTLDLNFEQEGDKIILWDKRN